MGILWLDMLAYNDASATFSFNEGYFHENTPELCISEESYTGEGSLLVNSTTYQWSHRMGEFVTAAASAGLTVRTLAEFPYCYFRMFPCMVQRSGGYWEIPDHSWAPPVLYGLQQGSRGVTTIVTPLGQFGTCNLHDSYELTP